MFVQCKWPLIIRHGLVAVAYLGISLLLMRPEVILLARIGFVAWYPAVGLTMALMLGLNPCYGLLFCISGPLAGKLYYGQPVFSYSSAFDAVGVVIFYGSAAYLLRSGRLKIDLELRCRRDVVRYVGVSTMAAAIAAVLGVGCLLADHSIAWSDARSSLLGWFFGDCTSLLGLTPFLLVHLLPRVRRWLAPEPIDVAANQKASFKRTIHIATAFETLVEAASIGFTLWIIFGSRWGDHKDFYLSFIPIVWIATRHGMRGVVTGLAAMNFGVVIAMRVFPPTPALYAEFALFMLLLSAAGLIVGSGVSERNRISADLQEQTAYLNSLIQNSPFGIVVLDRGGKVELANEAFEKLFGYNQGELALIDIGGMWSPAAAGAKPGSPIPQIFAGETLHQMGRQQRKNGQFIDLSLHAVPLMVSGQVRGAYMIYEDVSEQIRASEAQGEQAERLNRLVRQLEVRTQQMTLQNDMGNLLECSATVEEACAVVAHWASQLFPDAACGALYLFKSSRNSVEAVVHWGDESLAETAFVPDACWSLRRGQPHWSDQPGKGIACAHLAARSEYECLCVPMMAHGNMLGTLHVEYVRAAASDCSSDCLRESRQRLAISVAGQVGLSLANLRLRDTLREQSIRDPLTRLFNRRFMEESLARELQFASRNGLSLAVILIDLDRFKIFNDTYGHDAGDFVLQSIADLFRRFFRTSDICCRPGGEEFAIILPASNAMNAATRANLLRAEVKSLRLNYHHQPLVGLTISAGVAAFPEHAATADQLLRRADQSLYKSKANGRDLVTVANASEVLQHNETAER